MFKNFEDYKAQRDTLLDEAEGLATDGKMDEYSAKVDEVHKLDSDYTAFAQAQADMEALRTSVSSPNVISNKAKDGIIKSVEDSIDNSEIDHRKAFMNYVLKGERMPEQFMNTDATTVASEVGAVIPTTVLDKIIEKMESVGHIYSRVTKTYFKGGVTVPTSSAKPTATWTTESGTTDKQEKTTGSVTFSYYKLRCVVAVSIAVDNVTLDIFEKTIINNISEAMVKAIESAIINGTGSANNQPTGILTETAPSGQTIEITEGNSPTYATICSAEGALPEGYDSAVWLMKKKTYMEKFVGMVDSQGQPIARTSVGIDGKPSYNLLGREVVFCENVPAFSTSVSADTTFAFIFRLEDYMLNTNLNVSMKKYTDEATDDEMRKAIMLVDGKAIDINSLVKVVVKNA